MTITSADAVAHARPASKKFRTIYADPPWDIQQKGARGAIRHYDLMTIADIKSMPVADLAEDDATLFLWTTSAALPAAIEVVEAWGFRYIGILIWNKRRLGLGTYARISHEILIHGIRGRAPWKFHGQDSVFEFPRTSHSTKPAECIPMIERVVDGPYLELFARRRPNSHEDWSVWGNEIDSDITIPGYPVPSDFTRRASSADGEDGDA